MKEQSDSDRDLAKLMEALEKNRLEMEQSSEKAKLLNSAIESNKEAQNKGISPPSIGEITP